MKQYYDPNTGETVYLTRAELLLEREYNRKHNRLVVVLYLVVLPAIVGGAVYLATLLA